MNINSTSSNGSIDYSRITGLATGMDIENMVKQGLAREQSKIDKVNQDVEYLKWQQEAYVDAIKDFKDFNNFFDVLKADNMLGSSTYAGVTASSDKENVVTAKALPGAMKGNYEVKIDQLASGAKIQNSLGLMSDELTFANATNLNENTITFTVDGKAEILTISGLTDTSPLTAKDKMVYVATKIQDLINNNTNLKGKVNIQQLDGKFLKFTSTATEEIKLKDTTIGDLASIKEKIITRNSNTKLSTMGIAKDDEFKISVASKSFIIKIDNADISLNDFLQNLKNVKSDDVIQSNKVTLASLVDVNFSDLTNKLTFGTRDTGLDKTLKIEDFNSTKLALKLGVLGDEKGANAKVQIKAPGETDFVTLERKSNSLSIDNMNFNFKAITGVSSITVGVAADATAAVDKFKKFIEKYNTIVEKFNTKIKEKKEYTYKPLTEAQKSSMKDEEKKNWETAAKKGILRRDENITKLLSGMRSAMTTAVENAGISLSYIGITTTSNYMDGGKLKLDETKLKSALEEKGDLVQKLFTQSETTEGTKGIFPKIKGTLDSVIGLNGTLVKKAGYTDSKYASDNELSKKIKDKNKIINDIKTKMADKQKRLYSMYAALEKSMNQLNSQSNWLGSQLG